jgi:hypothetical protein
MVNLPENPYERNLSPTEIKELEEDGWRRRSLYECVDCFGSGCAKCHNIGVIGTYVKEEKYVYGSPHFSNPDSVGASCKLNYCGYDGKVHITAKGCGGSAKLYLTIPQMVRIMRMTTKILDNVQENCEEVFGVEAEFRGPPVVALASLSKDRVTVATIPSENQKKALKLLREAGLEYEAVFLKSAFEHEIFRGDEEENRKAREAVGEIKPGTIFSREGDNAVVDGVEVKIDSGFSLLSQLGRMKGR